MDTFYLIIGVVIVALLTFVFLKSDPAAPPASCVPDCTGKSCGDDGCSGTCGTCKTGQSCISGQCADNLISCSDGTSCPSGKVCISGYCTTVDCNGKHCGTDSNGVSCGTCGSGETCSTNQQCVKNNIPPTPVFGRDTPYYACSNHTTVKLVDWSTNITGTPYSLSDLTYNFRLSYPSGDTMNTIIDVTNTGGTAVAGHYWNADPLILDTSQSTANIFVSAVAPDLTTSPESQVGTLIYNDKDYC
jgi:hypothetical protein